ncbi:T9SS type A sorting domain-containing protein [Hymenobacter canadensis]
MVKKIRARSLFILGRNVLLILLVQGWLVLTCRCAQAQVSYSQLAAGTFHSAALQTDGKLWMWGRNNAGQLGNGSTAAQSSTPVVVVTPSTALTGTTWKQVAAGTFHTVALRSDGTLWAWGDNSSGQLGDGSTTSQRIPVFVPTPVGAQAGTSWTQVVAGYAHTLALRSDGTLWAWGGNLYGQLGDGTTTDRHLPVRVRTSLNLITEPTWVQITTANHHSLGITMGGGLWAWGRNHLGQLGVGAGLFWQSQPLRVVVAGQALTWKQVSAGESHTLALTTNNELWAWGTNESGQLGSGAATIVSTVPVRVPTPTTCAPGTQWMTLAAGALHSLALRSDSTLWSWGEGADGQLGNNTTILSSTPMQEDTKGRWRLLAAGGTHSLAVSTSRVYATGSAEYGQLGMGNTVRALRFKTSQASPLTAQQHLDNSVRIFPNPAVDLVYITGITSSTLLSIHDLQGRIIRQTEMIALPLDISHLPSGMYLLNLLQADGTRFKQKLLIQH